MQVFSSFMSNFALYNFYFFNIFTQINIFTRWSLNYKSHRTLKNYNYASSFVSGFPRLKKSFQSNLILILFLLLFKTMPSFTHIKRPFYQRSKSDYIDLSDKFKIKERKYDIQYYPYYTHRIEKMMPMVLKSISKCWGSEYNIIKLSDLSDYHDRKVIITGILFKHMISQPTILKEISEDSQLNPQSAKERFTESTDYLLLQDERETIKLVGNISVSSHVTGIMVGLLGTVDDNGNQFNVENICYVSIPEPTSRQILEEDRYVIIVSGLGFSQKESEDLIFARDMFVDFVTGMLGSADAERSSKIVKIIIAGNCVSKKVKQIEEEETKKSNKMPWDKKSRLHTIEVMKMVDDFFSNLGKSVDIDVMPGPTDPTNLLLPQQPLIPCILPRSSVLTSVRCVTNPYFCSLDKVKILGTSGQNIKSIKECSELDDSLEILEKSIDWAHIAPTAPDTLQSYPYPDKDPFIIDTYPHIYFAGNQSQFNSKLKRVNGDVIRLVSVPDFENDHNCALLNLRNLDCELLAFG